MAITKRDIINQAFDELGIASYAFDLGPEDLQSCLRRLDSMMAEWYAMGIVMGYPIPLDFKTSDLDEDTTLDLLYVEGVVANLAKRIAPAYGKQPLPTTNALAAKGYALIVAKFAPPPGKVSGATPSGAGNLPNYGVTVPFLNGDPDVLT